MACARGTSAHYAANQGLFVFGLEAVSGLLGVSMEPKAL